MCPCQQFAIKAISVGRLTVSRIPLLTGAALNPSTGSYTYLYILNTEDYKGPVLQWGSVATFHHYAPQGYIRQSPTIKKLFI